MAIVIQKVIVQAVHPATKKQTQIKLIMMGMMMVTMMYIWMKIMTGIDTGRTKIMPGVWTMHLRTWKMEIGNKWQATC